MFAQGLRPWIVSSSGAALGLIGQALPNVSAEFSLVALILGAALFLAPPVVWAVGRLGPAIRRAVPSWRPRAVMIGKLRSSDLIGCWEAVEEYVQPHCRPDDPDGNATIRAVAAFKTAAFDEDIEVWGREEGTATYVRIEKWFWRNTEMDILESIREAENNKNGNGGVFQVGGDPYSPIGAEPRKFVGCVTDRRQVSKLWPKA
jgi:hypothetical protein